MVAISPELASFGVGPHKTVSFTRLQQTKRVSAQSVRPD